MDGCHEDRIWGSYEKWNLVPYPTRRNVIDNNFVYKVKYKSDGKIEKYKAR